MRIQHNIMAMNAYRNYNNNNKALSGNLEKLSSGYKINRAGDDAAGLAISEKMRAQITGLNAAQKNVKDGISLVKTAEGAMQEIQDMLNRMDYLATQSANGTYDSEVDRAALQKEVNQLKEEINRIADSANFNGIKLLDGSWAKEEIVSALGSTTPSGMTDGTKPTAAGVAGSTVKLGAANAGVTPKDADKVAAETFDGATPSAATKAKFTFTTASATEIAAGATATSIFGANADGTDQIKDLGDATVTIGGNTVAVKDAFKVTIDGTEVADWTSTDAIAQGKEIVVEYKNGGQLDSTEFGNLKNGITNAVGGVDAVPGKNEGTGTPAVEANYSFNLDLTKLAGGQTIELGGTTLTVSTSIANTGANYIEIAGKTQAEIATEIGDKLTAKFGNFTVTVGTPDANGVAKVSMKANDGQHEAGNLGDIHFSNNPTDLVSGYNYTKYAAEVTGTVGKHAQVTYQSDLLKTGGDGLKAGATIEIGGTKINIVKDDATVGANDIKESDVATKLVETIEKLTNNSGLVQYDATNGKLTFTAKELGTGKLTALETATKVTVTAPPTTAAVASGATGYGGQDITFGTTTLGDLKNKEVTLTTGETVKLGDVFNISAKDKANATVGDSNALNGEATITFEAKKAGKLDANLMKAINYSNGATSNVTDGWDEGKAGGANKTQYALTINTDKVAGGQSITFGTDPSKSITFDLSMDADPVNNGTVVNPDPDTEVGNNRYTIKLGGQTTGAAIAEKIRSEIGSKMTDFNVTVEGSGNTWTLKMEAKTSTEDTNLGNVRYSSQAGAFSGADYKAYFPTGAGNAGTYAQVEYDFDLSKLASGDKLTIGGKTVYIGDADETKLNDDGTAVDKVTVKADGLTASKLVKAFETAGYMGGQIKINTTDKKLTITDSEAVGGTANALKGGKGAVAVDTTGRVLSNDTALTLQIGDTSESFNQLKVNIGSMKTSALGIDNLSIATAADAAGAINTIKAAINQVSSVRGDLGAYQNRLEHTGNNLSVMAENIQDAESTIRDTDVAEEMMSYVKNNILVQSAQAMLAQANQVPQGVLQLLG